MLKCVVYNCNSTQLKNIGYICNQSILKLFYNGKHG